MEHYNPLATVILIFTGLITYQGLRDQKYQERYSFWTDGILVHREFGRMISSGFLHGGWFHFGFNMIAMVSFATSLGDSFLNIWQLALVYFGSLLGGSALSLFVHRNHADYRGVGASGAVSGLIFASIVLYPAGGVSLFVIDLPNWFFALIFIAVSIFGIKTQAGNIGHAAHLGGALAGILLAFALRPTTVLQNQWMLMLTLFPILGFVILIIRNPTVLLIDNYWGEGLFKAKEFTKRTPKPEKSIDEILDKINQKGIGSLTKKEKNILDRFNKK